MTNVNDLAVCWGTDILQSRIILTVNMRLNTQILKTFWSNEFLKSWCSRVLITAACRRRQSIGSNYMLIPSLDKLCSSGPYPNVGACNRFVAGRQVSRLLGERTHLVASLWPRYAINCNHSKHAAKCRNSYSRPALLRFWPAEDLTKVGCLLACLEPQSDKVNCTYGNRGKTLDQTRRSHCISDLLLAYRLKISLAKNRALNYSNQACQDLRMETQGSSINRSQRHLSVFRYNSLELSQRKVTRVHLQWNRYFKYASMIIRCDSGPTDWLPVKSVARGGTYKILQLNFQQAFYVLDIRIHRQLGAV